MKTKIALALPIVVIAILLFLTANTAALVVEKDIGTLTSEADTILIGTVTDLHSQWEEGKIFTYVTISASEYIKGAKGGEVTIKVPGGTVGDISCYVSDAPAFEKGEEVVVFLREKDNYFDVVGWYQGKYNIEGEEVLGTGLSVDDFAAFVRGKMFSQQGIEKGRTEPAIMEVAYAVFNLPEAKISSSIPESEHNAGSGWVTIKHEGFEGAFPNDWEVSGNPTWGKTNYKYYAGSWSGWCASGGTLGLDPAISDYANNMGARMTFGPFSLSDATDANVTFYHWTKTESGYDWFSYYASIDGTNWYGYRLSGDWTPWKNGTFDLKNVPTLGNLCGKPQVWIRFKFASDSSITDKGTFIDEIYIQKYIGAPPPTPAITSITPDYGPAKAKQLGSDDAAPDSTRVTISGSNFGTSPGYVKFWRVGTTYHNAAIESLSDTRIVCRVPGGVSSYNKSDGSGNVHVVTSGGAISNTARFHVNYSYNGGKWAETSTTPPNTQVTYKVNPNTGDCLDELGAVQRAASTWNNSGANFSFVYAGTTTKTSVGADGENSIIWVSRDTGSIATAWTYWRTTDPKTILEADIEFNDLVYTWNSDITCPTGKMDVQNIATHELGHWLSLADLYGTTDSEKTMYGFAATCETKKRTVEPDDIAGIRDVYGTIETTTISISTDKTSYTTGDTMLVSLDITNPGDALPVSVKIGVEKPDGGIVWFINKPSVTLPTGLEYSKDKVITLPSIPAGTYTWRAILKDPATGLIICEDTASWDFVPAAAPAEDITGVLEQATFAIDFGG